MLFLWQVLPAVNYTWRGNAKGFLQSPKRLCERGVGFSLENRDVWSVFPFGKLSGGFFVL